MDTLSIPFYNGIILSYNKSMSSHTKLITFHRFWFLSKSFEMNDYYDKTLYYYGKPYHNTICICGKILSYHSKFYQNIRCICDKVLSYHDKH